jgi:hypothetical protein
LNAQLLVIGYVDPVIIDDPAFNAYEAVNAYDELSI